MYHALVTKNIILIKRLKDIGPISRDMARRYGATGPVARGSGINFDVRRFVRDTSREQLNVFRKGCAE